jgi:hypothetical protein
MIPAEKHVLCVEKRPFIVGSYFKKTAWDGFECLITL